MPRYIFKTVFVLEAFDDIEARKIVTEKDVYYDYVECRNPIGQRNCMDLERMTLNRDGSSENILRRGEMNVQKD